MMPQKYDVLLKGGHVVDPTQNLDGTFDVAVVGGKIAAVEADISTVDAVQTVDVSNDLVIAGMIDTHAHVFQHVGGRFGLNPDMVGVHSGVTTLVDLGGPSCMTFGGFRHYICEPSVSHVVAFISAYVVGGLEGHYYTDLYNPKGVDVYNTVRAIDANRDLVKGIKAHAEIGGYTRWGNEVMKLAKQIGTESGLPIYVHLGQLWPLPDDGTQGVDPDTIVPDMVELLGPGDILAHPFTRHPGGFVNTSGELHPAVRDALDRGMKVDIGHGSHFSFDMARKVLEAGVIPDTLGADMHGYNTKVPPPPGTPEKHSDPDENHLFAGGERFSLAFGMTELLALGLSLSEIVPMVTSNCAEMLEMGAEIGTLKPGTVADVSVLADLRGRWTLRDNEGHEITAERQLRPLFCLREGKRFDADALILPELDAAA
jgi:dihydroorotase